MNKNNLAKTETLFKPLFVLVLSMVLLLSGAVLPTREAKAAPVEPTREVNLSSGSGNVDIADGEVVRVYQNAGTTTDRGITVLAGAKATVILENVNKAGYENASFFRVMENGEATILLKGENKVETPVADHSGLYMKDGAKTTIEDYGDGDGVLNLSQTGDKKFTWPTLGMGSGEGFLTINSGKVVATSRDDAPAIGATTGSTLNLTINDPAVVEAHTLGRGAAIGTPGWIQDETVMEDCAVNATINGGTVVADNASELLEAKRVRTAAVIGSGSPGRFGETITLNIPETSTAKLQLSSYGGGAAIGGYGETETSALTSRALNQGWGETKQNITANIAGGTIDIAVRGKGPGIGIGANLNSAFNQNVTANISGGDINIQNDLYTTGLYISDTTGPSIGVGSLTQGHTMTCNITGGNVRMLSQDNGDHNATSPAVGVGAMNKNNSVTSKWEQAKDNTVNFNVSGGTVSAETRSADESLLDVGVLANNTLNVKVDGGSLNAVNQRMNVTAKNSENQNVYPATVHLAGITEENTAVENAAVEGKDYGKDLTAQAGKLYLWTTPGQNKGITASVTGDSRAYVNTAANLDYTSGFTFAEPEVTLKKAIAPEELGSYSIKNIADNDVTVQVNDMTSPQPVIIQAYEHGTSTAVGDPQTYEVGKTDYIFSGLTKNKLYDIKAKVNETDLYGETESEALVVKPFAYAPTLPNAKLKGAYEASVAAEGGSFSYALADGAVLPEGLTLSKNGTLSGKPTQIGDFNVNITATATDEGLSANNSRTESVNLKVEGIKAVLSVVDQAGQPLNCGCELSSTAAKEGAAVGDTVLFTLSPCPLHDFVKLNLNSNDVQAVSGPNGKYTYSYIVKAEDSELNMKAFMMESEKRIIKIERVGDEKELVLFANDEKNESLAQLKAFVNNNITLKATYNDSTEKTGKANDLGLGWATNSIYSPKGGTYEYRVSADDTHVTQTVTVNTVTAELSTLSDVVRAVSEEGYTTIASLGLPETIACTYQAGVPVNSEDREAAIDWTTEIPENFGKTATEEPVVFEGTAAVPEWATLDSNAVSVKVSISDKVVLVPTIAIEDKTYDGTKTASFLETPALDPEALTEGTDVQLSGIPKAEFSSADAGKNIPVKVSGLSLSGTDAGKYVLDLSQTTGNILPAPISLDGVAMEDKTVTEDGKAQSIEISGTLPEGVSVRYTYQKEGASEGSEQAPSAAGTYTVTASFKTDANHVVEPAAMSAKLVIEEKSTGVVVEEITTGLTEEEAVGMNATVLKNDEAVQVGDTVAVGDKLTYQFVPEAVREAYVPYAFTLNGETVAVTKLAEGKGYSAEYTVKEGDTALKADAKCVLLGNFSGDKVINIIDAQQIAQAAAASGTLEDLKKAAGDVNFDNKINVIDAQRVAQYAADTSVVF